MSARYHFTQSITPSQYVDAGEQIVDVAFAQIVDGHIAEHGGDLVGCFQPLRRERAFHVGFGGAERIGGEPNVVKLTSNAPLNASKLGV